MNFVHARLADRIERNDISASDILLDASCLASGTVPFVLVRHRGMLFLTVDVEGQNAPVTLGLTRDFKAELRPFPPMIGSSTTYEFEYRLLYGRDTGKRKPDIADTATTKTETPVGHQLPSMSMYASQPNGDRVYIIMTDDENEPLQTIIKKQNEAIGKEVLFRIQIDQFNAPCLEDFVSNTPRGRAMCAAKDFTFASIFDTATEVGMQACAAAAKRPQDNTKTSPSISNSTGSATVSKQAAILTPPAEGTTATTATAVAESEPISSTTTSSSKTFMTKYWYIFLIGAISLIVIIIGIFVVTSSSIARNKQINGSSTMPNPPINVQYLQPPQNSQPMTLRSPILKPFGQSNGMDQRNGLDHLIMSLWERENAVQSWRYVPKKML